MSNVTVEDANGVQRVLLGNIGTANAPDYGLKVIGADGSTTIIDGTSDMFKIVATGTLSVAWPAVGSDAAAAVVISAAGAFATIPAILFSNVWDNTAVANQRRNGEFIANNLGTGAITYRTYAEAFLDGSSIVNVDIHANSVTIKPSVNSAAVRYYLLVEVGI